MSKENSDILSFTGRNIPDFLEKEPFTGE